MSIKAVFLLSLLTSGLMTVKAGRLSPDKLEQTKHGLGVDEDATGSSLSQVKPAPFFSPGAVSGFVAGGFPNPVGSLRGLAGRKPVGAHAGVVLDPSAVRAAGDADRNAGYAKLLTEVPGNDYLEDLDTQVAGRMVAGEATSEQQHGWADWPLSGALVGAFGNAPVLSPAPDKATLPLGWQAKTMLDFTKMDYDERQVVIHTLDGQKRDAVVDEEYLKAQGLTNAIEQAKQVQKGRDPLKLLNLRGGAASDWGHAWAVVGAASQRVRLGDALSVAAASVWGLRLGGNAGAVVGAAYNGAALAGLEWLAPEMRDFKKMDNDEQQQFINNLVAQKRDAVANEKYFKAQGLKNEIEQAKQVQKKQGQKLKDTIARAKPAHAKQRRFALEP